MNLGSASRDRERTVTVRAGHATGERVRLSVYDLLPGTFATRRTFYYRGTLDADALRASLRATLVHYPMLTGRLERDTDGGLSVVCNDAGVPFTECRSERPLPDYGPDHSARGDMRRHIHQVNPFRVVGHDTPLFTAKATHLRGGFALGITANHSIMDGASCVDFLLHWSRTHRGLDHRPAPYARTLLDGLAEGAPPGAGHDDPQYAVVTRRRKFGFLWRVNAGAPRVRTLTTRFTAQEVLALKEVATAQLAGGGPRISSGDALAAQVWRVLGALRGRRPSLRGRLPDGYWGNAVSNTTASLPARALREGPLGETAAAVRTAVERVTAARVREETAFLEAQHRAGALRRVLSRMALDAFEDTVGVNNVSRLPFYSVEFDTGRPFWFEYPTVPIPWSVMVTPTPDDDHGRDVHLSLPRDAAALLESPEWTKRLHDTGPTA
jgi:shikimate O-hydroxycinnamoyltransferase